MKITGAASAAAAKNKEIERINARRFIVKNPDDNYIAASRVVGLKFSTFLIATSHSPPLIQISVSNVNHEFHSTVGAVASATSTVETASTASTMRSIANSTITCEKLAWLFVGCHADL
jgi:hypothetical protein